MSQMPGTGLTNYATRSELTEYLLGDTAPVFNSPATGFTGGLPPAPPVAGAFDAFAPPAPPPAVQAFAEVSLPQPVAARLQSIREVVVQELASPNVDADMLEEAGKSLVRIGSLRSKR